MTNDDILREVKRLGVGGKEFKYKQLREALGIAPVDKVASAGVYNFLIQLKNDLIVEVVEGNRTRNKHFRIRDENRLRNLLGLHPSGSGAQPPLAGPGRLTRIEGEVHVLQERLDQLESRMSDVSDHLDQLSARVGDFIAMWS